MLPSINFNTFTSSWKKSIFNALSETCSLGKEIVKEACSQALGMIPAAVIAISGNSTLRASSNIICGSLSVIKGLRGYGSFKQVDGKVSKVLKLAESTRDIGVGCLFIANVVISSNSVTGKIALDLLLLYFGMSNLLRSIRACGKFGKLILGKTCIPSLSQKGETKRDLAKIIVDFSFVALKVNAMHDYINQFNNQQRAIHIFNQELNTPNLATDVDQQINTPIYYNQQPDFLFRRDRSRDSEIQIPLISERAYSIIQSKSTIEDVIFNKTTLYPFDEAGTCSAMALGFISDYNTKCNGVSDKISCINELKDSYISNNEVFSSVQAAFNTIQVVANEMSQSDIAYKKMQALANYHDLSLTPVTETLETQNTDKIKSVFENLPYGSYVVRMLKPDSNHKKEMFGHTMSFIKDSKESLYFDNYRGLSRLDNQDSDTATGTGENFLNSIQNWFYIPQVRIYKAECPPKGCENLPRMKARISESVHYSNYRSEL